LEIARNLGFDIEYEILNAKKWNKQRLIKTLHDFALEIDKPGYMPMQHDMLQHGRTALRGIVSRFGGQAKVAKLAGLIYQGQTVGEDGRTYWSENKIKQFLHEVSEKEANPGSMPTVNQCQKYAPNPNTIWTIISRHGIYGKGMTWFEVAQKYGLKYEKNAANRITLSFVKAFVSALGDQIQHLTPSEVYILFEQQGITKKQRSIAQPSAFEKLVGAIQSGNLPQDEIKRWTSGEKGELVEALLSPDTNSIEDAFASVGRDFKKTNRKAKYENPTDEQYLEDVEQSLPVPRVLDALTSLDKATTLIDQTTSDKEAIDFLIAKAAGKLWTQCFRDEQSALNEAKQFSGNQYAQAARDTFLEEYTRSKQLPLPVGYDFRDNNGKLRQPKLMQKLIAYRVQKLDRVLNLSGTGTGKTLSAILASRVIGAHMTVISCPNATIDGWQTAIKNAFSNSEVQTKTWAPEWQTKVRPRYLVLNHEMFRDSNTGAMKAFIAEHAIDFVVIDELHQVKQRDEANESQRRKLMSALITDLPPLRLKPRVLGMTATPIINNLQEGKSLIELVSGLEHNEIDVKVNVQNCMKVYQKFTTMGFRMMPTYRDDRLAKIHPIDCTPFLDDLLALGHTPHPQAVEAILVRSRWPKIKQCLRPKTVIFTDYVKDIVDFLRKSVIDAGFSVGLYTGSDKESTELEFDNMLDQFKFGATEVLIASTKTLATGVDGLQHVCNNVIFATLPWTNTDYEQAIGRFDREGFQFDTFDVHVPKTYAVLSDGQEWSWCESKLARIENKKGIARAAVDGEIPDTTQQLTPEKATGYWMSWLKRITEEGLSEIERKEIKVPLDESDAKTASARLANYGDFSRINARWNSASSSATHTRLQENSEEWCYYHTRLQEHERTWQLVPRLQCIEHLRSNIPRNSVVADFGCGQAQLAEALKGVHTVYSLDHVAINQTVIACDMSDSGLESDSLNAAVFSLSLMGGNMKDYLLEAYRTLMVGGQLLIYHPAENNDRNKFIAGLEKIGFATTKEGKEYKWHYIWAIKVGKQENLAVDVSF
jgi:superfamily II DNA or RNA helicase